MRREISNPSDRATIDYTDPLATCLAVVLLGRGRYGIREEMPTFFMGGHDEWFTETFGMSLQMAFDQTDKSRIAAALDTVQLEGERTSLNDIVGHAKDIAERLREDAP